MQTFLELFPGTFGETSIFLFFFCNFVHTQQTLTRFKTRSAAQQQELHYRKTWRACWNMRVPLYHKHTLTALTTAAQLWGCFLFVSWGVWVDTSALLFIKAFITSPLLRHPRQRGSRRCPLTHKHLWGVQWRGWGWVVALLTWCERLNQIQDPSQTIQVEPPGMCFPESAGFIWTSRGTDGEAKNSVGKIMTINLLQCSS